MRYLLLLIFVCLSFPAVFAQDILVLRKDESELKCRIVALNDSAIAFKLWDSPDKSIHTIRKYEVQSYMMDYKSQKSRKLKKSMKVENADLDLLGEYRNGSVEKGYIIKENGDSLHGLVVIQNFAMSQVRVEFNDSTGKTRMYTTTDLKGYGYHNIAYDRIPIKYKQAVTNGTEPGQETLFLHRTVTGPSQLYRFYTLDFKNSTMHAYNQVPPYYLGKANQHFVITNPDGKFIFTKGRSLKGSINKIYSAYPEFLGNIIDTRPDAGEMPGVVKSFNYWYENQRKP